MKDVKQGGWGVVRVMRVVNKASSAAQRSVRGCSRRKKRKLRECPRRKAGEGQGPERFQNDERRKVEFGQS